MVRVTRRVMVRVTRTRRGQRRGQRRVCSE